MPRLTPAPACCPRARPPPRRRVPALTARSPRSRRPPGPAARLRPLRAPCRSLGEELGKSAAAAAAKGRSGAALQAAWAAALRELGPRAAAAELPGAARAGLAAAGRAFFGGGAAVAQVAGGARQLLLLSLVAAIGEAADGPLASASDGKDGDVDGGAPRWRGPLTFGEAAGLVGALAPVLGPHLPLAMASALAGHLRGAGTGAASPAAAEAAAAARAAVDCAVRAPEARGPGAPPPVRLPLPPPPPPPAALALAAAELVVQINGRLPTPEAHATIYEIGRGLAATGDGDAGAAAAAPLAAALAQLPAAAAAAGRRGWPCWGPLLAALCAAGCGVDGGEGAPRERVPYYGRRPAGAAAAPPRRAGDVFVEPAALLAAMTASARAQLSEVLTPGPHRAAAAARGRGAALAAAALLSWLQETGDATPRPGAPAAAPEGPYALLPAKRDLAQAASALAAAAGAPAGVVDALEQQWQLGLAGLPGGRALAGGQLLATLDHAAFLDADAVAAQLPPPPVLTAAPLDAPPAHVRAAPAGAAAAAKAPAPPSPPVTPSARAPGRAPPSPRPAPPAPPLPPGGRFAVEWRGAGGSGAVSAALEAEEAAAERRAAEMEAEAALEDLTDEVVAAADRLCRRLATDAALLGRWPGARAGGGRRTGPFEDGPELLLHLRALARTAPTPDAARRRLLPLRQGLLHLERLAARLPCPTRGWFAGAAGSQQCGSNNMIWTLHEALWEGAASGGGAAAKGPGPAPPPPARLLALVLGLLPTERAASAAAQARLAAAAEASGLAAAADAGAAEDFPPELLVAPSAETWWRGVLGANGVLED
jgi:hypothetical protein